MASNEGVGYERPDRFGLLKARYYRRLCIAVGEHPRGDVRLQRDIPVPMDDGTELLTHHWAPAGASTGAVVMVRTPYGRDSCGVEARLLAAAGHHVVIQSCRGSWGSGGRFDPIRDEQRDGRACVRWIEAQPWFSGEIVTFGHSYAGLTQWALADDPPASVRAMVIGVSARSFRDSVLRHGGGFGMEMAVTWALGLGAMELPPVRRVLAQIRAVTAIRKGSDARPPREAVRVATGSDVHYIHDWLDHDIDDEWWQPIQFAQRPGPAPSITLVGGWYDMFVHAQVADFVALRRGEVPARLVVGPWSHLGQGVGETAMIELWRVLGRRPSGEHAVTVFPVGSSTKADLASWPPPATRVRYYPQGAELATEPPAAAERVSLRFDPSDPTPSVGGRSLNPLNCGPKDQRPRERRPDVLVFTSEPLPEPLLVAGDLTARVSRSGATDGDLFVRLCEVDERGRSVNLADGYRRFAGLEPECTEVELSLGPLVAYVRKGRRLRLQISAGAHPQYLRHPGTGEPLGDHQAFRPIEQQIHLGASATCLELPLARFGISPPIQSARAG